MSCGHPHFYSQSVSSSHFFHQYVSDTRGEVCAVASRYHRSRPNVYQLAHGFAQEAAAKSLVDNSKSVDICQALLILAVYPLPKKKWCEDRSWLLMGVAIR